MVDWEKEEEMSKWKVGQLLGKWTNATDTVGGEELDSDASSSGCRSHFVLISIRYVKKYSKDELESLNFLIPKSQTTRGKATSIYIPPFFTPTYQKR